MAKRKKRKAAAPAANDRSAAFKAGDRVRVKSGDYGNSDGTVETVSGNKVTVHVHGRLTVTTTAGNLAAL